MVFFVPFWEGGNIYSCSDMDYVKEYCLEADGKEAYLKKLFEKLLLEKINELLALCLGRGESTDRVITSSL